MSDVVEAPGRDYAILCTITSNVLFKVETTFLIAKQLYDDINDLFVYEGLLKLHRLNNH